MKSSERDNNCKKRGFQTFKLSAKMLKKAKKLKKVHTPGYTARYCEAYRTMGDKRSPGFCCSFSSRIPTAFNHVLLKVCVS